MFFPTDDFDNAEIHQNDEINYWCRTHGVDISARDIADGRCSVGACEEEDADDYYELDYLDDEPAPPPSPRAE